jgi:hypothetical protein
LAESEKVWLKAAESVIRQADRTAQTAAEKVRAGHKAENDKQISKSRGVVVREYAFAVGRFRAKIA